MQFTSFFVTVSCAMALRKLHSYRHTWSLYWYLHSQLCRACKPSPSWRFSGSGGCEWNDILEINAWVDSFFRGFQSPSPCLSPSKSKQGSADATAPKCRIPRLHYYQHFSCRFTFITTIHFCDIPTCSGLRVLCRIVSTSSCLLFYHLHPRFTPD